MKKALYLYLILLPVSCCNTIGSKNIIDKTKEYQINNSFVTEEYFIQNFFNQAPKNNKNIPFVLEYKENSHSWEDIITYLENQNIQMSDMSLKNYQESLFLLKSLHFKSIHKLSSLFYDEMIDSPDPIKISLHKIKKDSFYLIQKDQIVKKALSKNQLEFCTQNIKKYFQDSSEKPFFNAQKGLFLTQDVKGRPFGVYSVIETYTYIIPSPDGDDGDLFTTNSLRISYLDNPTIIFVYTGNPIIIAFSLADTTTMTYKEDNDCFIALNSFIPFEF